MSSRLEAFLADYSSAAVMPYFGSKEHYAMLRVSKATAKSTNNFLQSDGYLQHLISAARQWIANRHVQTCTTVGLRHANKLKSPSLAHLIMYIAVPAIVVERVADNHTTEWEESKFVFRWFVAKVLKSPIMDSLFTPDPIQSLRAQVNTFGPMEVHARYLINMASAITAEIPISVNDEKSDFWLDQSIRILDSVTKNVRLYCDRNHFTESWIDLIVTCGTLMMRRWTPQIAKGFRWAFDNLSMRAPYPSQVSNRIEQLLLFHRLVSDGSRAIGKNTVIGEDEIINDFNVVAYLVSAVDQK